MPENNDLSILKPYVDEEYEKICREKRLAETLRTVRNSFHLSWEDDNGGQHSYINNRKHGESVAEFVLRSLKEVIDFESKVENEEPTETDHA